MLSGCLFLLTGVAVTWGDGGRNCVLVNDHEQSAQTVMDASLGAAVYEESGSGLSPDSVLDRERAVLA